MKRKLIVSIIIIFMSLGCSKKHQTVRTVYTPELQKPATAEIGENMFSKTYAYFQYKYIVILLDSNDRKKYKTRKQGNRFDELEGTKCALYNGSLSLLDYNCDGTFTHLRNGDKLEKSVEYKLQPAPPTRITKDSFKRDVIYQGKIGNKIKISFQEFFASNGSFMIRDAYTQNIEYELDANGQAMIGFKGLRIKILNATNLNIEYQVTRDFIS
ncbi:MAG: hypothetical protein GQ583_02590 [Methyloprofundus sp.]|nr:hypothetical protein [Methyloprofundus sp.]